MSKLIKFFSLLVSCLLIGCASYQTGTGTTIQIQNLYIAPVINNSFANQSQELLSAQLRSKFLNSNIKLVSQELAESTLSVTICDCNSNEASPKILTVTVNLTSQGGAKLINNQELQAEIDIDSSIDNFEETCHQSMPILTQKITDQIYQIVTTRW